MKSFLFAAVATLSLATFQAKADGNFTKTCSDCAVTEVGMLVCKSCKTREGAEIASQIDLNKIIANCDGLLTEDSTGECKGDMHSHH